MKVAHTYMLSEASIEKVVRHANKNDLHSSGMLEKIINDYSEDVLVNSEVEEMLDEIIKRTRDVMIAFHTCSTAKIPPTHNAFSYLQDVMATAQDFKAKMK